LIGCKIYNQPTLRKQLNLGGEKMDWKEIYMETLKALNRMIKNSKFSSKNDEMRLMLSAIAPLRDIDIEEIRNIKDMVEMVKIAKQIAIDYKGIKIVFGEIVEKAEKFGKE